MPAGHRRSRSAWAAALARGPRFEVLPLPGIAEELSGQLPPHATVTVTASPRRGLTPTLELTTALAARGTHVVPHLAARLVRDEAEVRRLVTDLTSAGVREVFVIGGDSPRPAGDFAGALDLLRAMERTGHDFTVGIAGYPETHPAIPDDVTVQALADKQPHAAYVVSQICFDARTILAWVRRLRRRGVTLPVRVGVPGPVSTARLLRVSAKVGVGQSLRVLTHHRGELLRLVQPGLWRPDRLLDDLAPAFTDPAYGLVGPHIYTFNAVDAAGGWWREVTARHAGPVGESTELTR